MLISLIEFISFVALVLYIIFAGADYGAGILELFKPFFGRNKNIQDEITAIINRAIGPVWEANHIWLILIVVILFNGFPVLYTTLTTYLHIPIVAVLLGIVLRGVAFTFRHYDVFKGRPDRVYTTIFSLSSFWTSVWLGIIAGAVVLGRIDPNAKTFYELYVHPWFNLFCLSVGLFVASVFTYLAASFLIGETNHGLMKSLFRKRALMANVVLINAGGLVFLASLYEGSPFILKFFTNKYSLLMMIFATIFWVMQGVLRKRMTFLLRRVLVVGQVVFILLGFFFVQSPNIITTTNGHLTMSNTAAPVATLWQLLVALLVGLVFILPSLLLLFWIFKFKDKKKAL